MLHLVTTRDKGRSSVAAFKSHFSVLGAGRQRYNKAKNELVAHRKRPCFIPRTMPATPTLSRKPSSHALKEKESSAKSRWKILASTVRKIKATPSDEGDVQPFRFPAFELVDIRPEIAPPSAINRLWFRISAPAYPEINLKVCIRAPQSTKLQDLTGFNNTGNICVWPSEEALATYCLENKHLFKGKRVLELGGGMTGLAGLVVAQSCDPCHVTLTDGNDNSAENLEHVERANIEAGLTNITSKVCYMNFLSIHSLCNQLIPISRFLNGIQAVKISLGTTML